MFFQPEIIDRYYSSYL